MNKNILLIVVLLFFTLFASAQSLEERYLGKANQEYLEKNYKEAYLYLIFRMLKAHFPGIFNSNIHLPVFPSNE